MKLLKIYNVWETDYSNTLCVEIDQKIADEAEPSRDFYFLVEGDEFGLAPTIREELKKLNLPIGSWEDCPANIPYQEPIPDVISRRQFFQQLEVQKVITKAEALAAITSGTLPQALEDIVSQIGDEDEQFNAHMLLIGAQTFERLHPLADTIQQIAGWTDGQRDQFWIDAYKL